MNLNKIKNMSIINTNLQLAHHCILSSFESNEVCVASCEGPVCQFYGKNECLCFISGHDIDLKLSSP